MFIHGPWVRFLSQTFIRNKHAYTTENGMPTLANSKINLDDDHTKLWTESLATLSIG